MDRYFTVADKMNLCAVSVACDTATEVTVRTDDPQLSGFYPFLQPRSHIRDMQPENSPGFFLSRVCSNDLESVLPILLSWGWFLILSNQETSPSEFQSAAAL